jgi:hypothetical protein
MQNIPCSVIYKCNCNKKTYPNDISLKIHFQSKAHKYWIQEKELKELKINLTEKDNQLIALKTKVSAMLNFNNLLMKRISIETEL